MAENLGGHKRVKNQYKHYDMVLKKRMAQEIGTLLNTFLDEGYMNKSLIKADFGIDYKTTADLLHAASSCSFGTMRKFAYVFAFYLHQAELEAKDIKYIVKHDENGRNPSQRGGFQGHLWHRGDLRARTNQATQGLATSGETGTELLIAYPSQHPKQHHN